MNEKEGKRPLRYKETLSQYSMYMKFINTLDPTAEQCLIYLRSYGSNLKHTSSFLLQEIPIKHREFCIAQLKLEGLL
ncbi:MAG: hypothetical protein OEZ01_04300 [Candidatus Heimdallarchaeota archaeon]|nr:hypothetical protein [Candidatus Heimdallarchaeota archaeon]